MSTLVAKAATDIVTVRFTETSLIVTLADARRLEVPLDRYPRLWRATPAQRATWRLIAGGAGIHWDDVDEDISARSLLAS
jgi:hypothetical protein